MADSTKASLSDLLASMDPDPDKPVGLDSVWTVASMIGGTIDAGVWSATRATWDELDYPVDEVIVMIEGHLRITEPDGEPHDLRRGDMYYFPKGWAGRWEVVEDMQKIYFVVA